MHSISAVSCSVRTVIHDVLMGIYGGIYHVPTGGKIICTYDKSARGIVDLVGNKRAPVTLKAL